LFHLFSYIKDDVTAAVQELLKLKEQYKTLTGTDAPSSGAAPVRKEKEKKISAVVKKPESEHASAASVNPDLKKQTK
jgi:hypothetical protein